MRTRAAILALVLAAAPLAAFAEDVLGPAEYLAIIAASKLHYRIGSEPAKNPVQEGTCPRRDVNTRIVTNNGQNSLVAWNVAPDALVAFNEGEKLFEAEKYDEAAAKYKDAIAKDPQAVMAYFSYGDAILFGQSDAAAALAQYQKGIALDPTLPVGHFFAATAYGKLGDQAAARASIVKALARHPAYDAVWRIAEKNPEFWGIRPVERHTFAPPAGYLGVKQKDGIDIYGGADNEYLAYALCKAAWANEKQFAKRHAKDGEWSLEEERACILNQAMAAYNAASDGKSDDAAIRAAMPPLERHLWDVVRAHQLDGYILFERIGQRCPIGMSLLDASTRALVEDYIRTYVILPAE